MTSPRESVLRLALALAGVVVALGATECGLRLYDARAVGADEAALHELRLDRGWLYGLRPGAQGRLPHAGDVVYRINAVGHRGPEVERPKPAGVYRILVLGDSVAFGYGVEASETFAERLQAAFARALPAARVEVVNLGVGGYNPYTEARLLEDVGASFDPDLVLVQFCINDLSDPTLHFDRQTRIRLGAIPDAAYPDPRRRWLPYEATPSWLMACRGLRLCARAHDLWLARTGPEPPPGAFAASARAVAPSNRHAWRWLRSRYDEIDVAARRAGAGVALVAVPFAAQLVPDAPDARTGVQQRLARMAHALGWSFVDPLPAFLRAGDSDRRLFLDWWHPTAAGHALIAAETLTRLACGDALPEDVRPACGADPATP